MTTQAGKKSTVTGQRLYEELCKIHPQWELAAAILLSLRGRFERLRTEDREVDLKNRIGKVFPDGDIGVVLLGDRGTRKTTLMKSIFHGLGFDGGNVQRDNEPMAHFVKSAGMATSVGLFEFFADHNDTIIFMDEMDWDNSGHFSIFKQISNGEIVRQKHGQTEPVNFNSLVIAATNSINMPSRKSDRQHLLAVLDRFYVLSAKPVTTDVHSIIDEAIDFEFGGQEVDWDYVRNCLTRRFFGAVNESERALVHAIWKSKETYVLGARRDQSRNVMKIIDCVLFFKRMLGLEDVTEHEHVVKMIDSLVESVIMFNPGSVISLRNELDEILYNAVAENDNGPNGVRMAEILDVCREHGQSVGESDRRRIINRLDNLVMSCLLVKLSKGRYSVKRPSKSNSPKRSANMKPSPLAGAF